MQVWTQILFYTKSQTWIIIKLAIPKINHVHVLGVSKILHLTNECKEKL